MQIGLSLGIPAPAIPSIAQRAISAIRRNGGSAWWVSDTLAGSGLYTDSTGTAPVSAVGDVLGLVTDRSYGASNLGPELVTNGDFSGGTSGWVGFGAGGWAVTGNAAAHTAGTYGLIQFNTPAATALKTYRVRFDCTLTAGDIKCYIGGTASVTFVTGGAKEVYVVAGASPSYLIAFEPSTSFAGSVDNISVKEVLGNHASQATTANKPVIALLANGRKAMSFDGLNDTLNLGSIPFQFTDNCTVIVASKPLSLHNGSPASVATSSNSYQKAAAISFRVDGAHYARWTTSTPTDLTTSPTYTYTANTPIVSTAIRSGSTGTHIVNGVQIGTVSLSGTATLNASYIGVEGNGVVFFNGSVSFVAAIPSAISDADRKAIERFAAYMSGATYAG